MRTLLRQMALLFLTGWSVLSAQEASRVSGYVRTGEGRPVMFANVAIRGLQRGTTTDTTGFYQLEVPSGREFELVFSFVGYETRQTTLHLMPGESKKVDQVLAFAVKQMEEVRIEADYRRVSSFVRIDLKDFQAIPSASGQFESILKTLPGVASGNELSAQYSVRGGNFDENLIYVNDIEIYRPFLIRSGQQEGLSFINADMVSSVRFSAGGFEASYGDKMSSVLDIRYRKPQAAASSVSLSFLGGSAHLEGVSKNHRFTHLTGFRYKTNRYLLNAMDVSGDYQPNFYDFQTYLTYDARPGLEFSLLGNIARNDYRFVPESRRTSFGTVSDAVQLYILYNGNEVDRFDTYMGAATAHYQPDSRLSLKWIVSSFKTSEGETFDIEGMYSLNEIDKKLGSENLGDSIMNIGIGSFLHHARNYLDGNVVSVEHKGFFQPAAAEWGWGLKYQYEKVENTIHEWERIDSAGYSIPYNNETVNLAYVNLASLEIASSRLISYLQYQRRFFPGKSTLIVNAGLRTHYWNYNSEFFLSPRASLWLEPGWKKNMQFRFSAGYYYQPPFFKELRDPSGNINPQIRSQRSFHWVLGTDYQFMAWDRPFKFMGEVYYKWMDRLVPYKVENVRIRYAGENLSKGYAAGIDLKVNGEFVAGVESWASLSLMRTREDIAGDSYTDRDGKTVLPGYFPRPTDQLVNFGLYFQDYLPIDPSYRVQLSLLYGTGLPASSPYTERYDVVFRMPSYRRVDIGFIKVIKDETHNASAGGFLQPFKQLWVSAEVFNLLGINNTISYLWINTVNNLSGENLQFAVPNYLTSRRLNIKFTARF